MRKIIPLILSLALVLALAACGSNDTTSEATTGTTAAEDTSTPTEVTITGLNGNGEPTDLTVPYDPQRIAILDMASLDILDALGLVSKVVEDRPALIPAGLELARVIAAKDPMAVRLTKEAMRANVDAA
ncbi:MAG: hypothetical protein MR910_08625, partial [Clostridiales bacterium]|nr:hypothetical protein [Clostridiales bacterium]